MVEVSLTRPHLSLVVVASIERGLEQMKTWFAHGVLKHCQLHQLVADHYHSSCSYLEQSLPCAIEESQDGVRVLVVSDACSSASTYQTHPFSRNTVYYRTLRL